MNPLFKYRNYFYGYTIFWALVAIAHFLFMRQVLGVTLAQAGMDSIVYNAAYYPLGVAAWYVVRFNQTGAGRLLPLIVVHLFSALVLSLIWIFLSYEVVINIANNPEFTKLQFSILPSRYLIGLLYYIIIILVYYLIIYYENFKEKIEKEAASTTLLREAELKALKLQINPHFIFNCLNSINSLILINPAEAQEMVVKLSDFLRSTLGGDSRHRVDLQDELKFSELYLEIEKIRFGSKLKFEIIMDEKLKFFKVPHMLLQPLLENAVKHGVQQSSVPVTIRLEINKRDDLLSIQLKNEINSPSRAFGKNIGLKNVKERLKLIYNRNDLLNIEEKKEEFIVNIALPAEPFMKHE